jgi:phosphatidylethanolamine/phosphatidyl-N-methylethanolamine N-methyltransferase
MIYELSHRLRNSDELRFFFHWLRRPNRIGAVVPSGSALATALAAEINTEAPGAVVELGAGTGRVTRALLEAGVAPSQLVAIERDASFCKMLRERFPGVQIISGEARTLKQLLHEAGVGPVKAVASSLPLLNMTGHDRRAVLAQIADILHSEGMLIQYTYGPAAPVPPVLGAELGLVGERTNWVLANLPPAAVWRYRRSCSVPRLLGKN